MNWRERKVLEVSGFRSFNARAGKLARICEIPFEIANLA